jgi:nitrogen fixation protein NifU and related proteins
MKPSFGKKNGNVDLALSPDFDRHARAPLHAGYLLNADGRAVGSGSCGDSIEISIRMRGEIITEIGHCPKGCAFTVACASAVCALALGRTRGQALQLQPEDVEHELGGLPEDHRHCARLAVNTLGEAIGDTYRQPNPER